MSDREAILGRLRAGRPAAPAVLPPVPADADVFADGAAGLLPTFQTRLAALHGESHVVPDVAAAASALTRLLAGAEPGPALRHPGALLDRVVAADPALGARLELRADLSGPELAKYAAGVTEADCLVARSGSIVLRGTTAGGRRLSVLPPLHVVVATAAQLVPSLDAALPRLAGGDSSYAAIITGPSRTGDIEKILVLGAHRPKRLAVILIENP
jgi:L-lactate dehydrogenase complex protein LldG